ncbi:hypothetical protein YB2330_005206 [Saitoella coloradoensis]
MSQPQVTPPPSKKRPFGDISNVPVYKITGSSAGKTVDRDGFTTPDHPSAWKKQRLSMGGASQQSNASTERSSGPKKTVEELAKQEEEDQVWPSDVEEAFMQAIKKIPKLGRRKISVNGKPCGRNELIADYIFRRTGKIRSRKQVSSHLQVLKHMKRDDPEFMSLVCDTTPGNEQDGDYDDDGTGETPLNGVHPKTFMGTKPRSVSNPSPTPQNLQQMTPHFFAQPGQPASLIARGLFKPTAFCVWSATDEPQGREQVVHMFTRLRTGLAPTPLESLSNWTVRFPYLADSLYKYGQIPEQILHFRAGIALPEVQAAETVLRTHLSLLCDAALAQSHQWGCTTKIYTMGTKVLELRQDVLLNQSQVAGKMKIGVPFATDFWAAFLTGLATIQGQVKTQAIDERERRKKERESSTAVGGISIVQELMGLSNVEDGRAPKIIMLVWELEKEEPGRAPGQTIWREVVVPASLRPQPQQTTMQAPLLRPSPSQPGLYSGNMMSDPKKGLGMGIYEDEAGIGGYDFLAPQTIPQSASYNMTPMSALGPQHASYQQQLQSSPLASYGQNQYMQQAYASVPMQSPTMMRSMSTPLPAPYQHHHMPGHGQPMQNPMQQQLLMQQMQMQGGLQKLPGHVTVPSQSQFLAPGVVPVPTRKNRPSGLVDVFADDDGEQQVQEKAEDNSDDEDAGMMAGLPPKMALFLTPAKIAAKRQEQFVLEKQALEQHHHQQQQQFMGQGMYATEHDRENIDASQESFFDPNLFEHHEEEGSDDEGLGF